MITLTSAIRAFSVTFTPSSELDVVGYLIHAAPQSVFVNGDFQPSEGTLVNKGAESSFYYALPDDAPSGTWGVKIAAYDSFGDEFVNYSNLQLVEVKEYDANDKTPPDAPEWLSNDSVIEGSGTLLTSSITLQWVLYNKPTDFLQYSIRYRLKGTTVWSEVSTKAAEYVFHGMVSGNSYEFQVKAVDKTGNSSEWSELLEVFAVKDTALTNGPSTFTATILDRWIGLNWTPSIDPDIAGYNIRVGPAWETSTAVAKVSNVNTYLWSPNKTGDMLFWINAYDYSGNLSVPRKAPFVLSITKPLFQSSSTLLAEVVDNNVLLKWPAATKGSYPIDHYIIKKGLDYTTAIAVGTKTGTFTTVFETESGNYKYWVAPVDSAGLIGDPLSVYAQVSQPPDFTLHDSYFSDYSGTKSNCYVEDGRLIAPVNVTESYKKHFDSNGLVTNTRTTATGGIGLSTQGWASPQDQISAGYPVYAQPGLTTGYYEETRNYGKVLSAKVVLNVTRTTTIGTVIVKPTISVSLDGVNWTDYPDVYTVYASSFQYLKYKLEFTTTDNGILRIDSIGLNLADKAKSREGTVYVTTAGTDVYMTDDSTSGGEKIFLAVNSIQLTAQGVAPRIAIYDYVAIPDPLSFKVYLFDMAGNHVAGWVSWLAKGV